MEKQALAGRYALGERVGTGGMAEVFVARDTRLERDVAVKLFRPGIADGLERGSAEARMLARLDHPGLVRVLDMDNGEDAGDAAYLVMELVEGPDLGVRLRTAGPLSREEVRLMALDLARTLRYIHGRGIVHRDIKPSNILTRDADPHSGVFRYLLTDFGIARFFDGGRMTATGQVIGSAAYFSPEQARGDAVDRPSDIYSLGLVLIEALTGERAFPGTGTESALARLHRSPSIPHAAGPALSALLVLMTLDGPGDRPDATGVVGTLTSMGPQLASEGQPGSARMSLEAPPTEAAAVRGVAPSAASPGAGDRTAPSAAGNRTEGHRAERTMTRDGTETARLEGAAPTRVTEEAHHLDAGRAVEDHRAPSRPVRRRTSRPWVLVLLAVVMLAGAGLWIFLTTTAAGPGPDIAPLPIVSGEPGEKLQELYESVQP